MADACAGGPAPSSSDHEAPSKTQVSPKKPLGGSCPPKRTSFPSTGAITAPVRELGPTAVTSVQVVPSKVHVSSNTPSPSPPKSTSTSPSGAKAARSRPGGPLTGSSVQLAPSNTHVSP